MHHILIQDCAAKAHDHALLVKELVNIVDNILAKTIIKGYVCNLLLRRIQSVLAHFHFIKIM